MEKYDHAIENAVLSIVNDRQIYEAFRREYEDKPNTVLNSYWITRVGAKTACRGTSKRQRNEIFIRVMEQIFDRRYKTIVVERHGTYGTYTTELFKPVSPQAQTPPTQEVIPMSTKSIITVKSQVLVDGAPISDYNDDSLFQKIQQAESQIKELGAIENRPKALDKRIEDLKTGVQALVAAMDARSA